MQLGDSAGSSDQQHTLQQLSKVLQNSINKGDAAITLGATISASGAMLVVFTVLSAGSMMALVVMGAGAALSWRGLRRRGLMALLPEGLMALLPEGVQQQLTQTTLLEWLTDTSFMDNMKPYLLFCLGPNTEETRLFLKFLPPAMRQRLTRPGLLHCLPEGVSSLLLPADDGAAQSHNNNDDDEQQQQQRQQQQRRRRQLQLPAFQHAAAESEGGEDSSDSEADSDSEVQDLESFEDSGGLVWTPLSPPCAASRAALGSPMAHGTPPHGVQHERDNPSSPDTSANATAAPSPFGGSETSAAARGAAAAAVTGAAADPAEHPTQQLRSIRSSSGSSSAGAVHDHPIAAAASPDASSVHGGDDNSGFSGSGATPTVEDLAWLLVRNRVRSAWDAVWGIVDKDAAGVVGGAAAALLAVHLGVSARAR
ncbi:hypothetical protein JKP88DRAFT_320524 [Tribonema minus]|uniref:Uncharacterized protein n=1 Tax=Tribonema minus TaxID=303371 RepID=A0A836CCY5_9STRA|nr:hypothetical protein JKP88DRAFT_320524 [Tribonema minus]